MIGWAITFFILGIVAAILGLSGIANLAINIGVLFIFVSVVLIVIYALTGRRPPPAV
ncbi:MAG: DUF1328 domain-containing protein [Candidatus Sumerlaeia bacterium]|nr:DUF1328 domain-containing protein [Candidatus Sumerlaeia bacterium]